MEPWKLKNSDPERMAVGAARRPAGRRRRQDAADAVPAVVVVEGARAAARRRARGPAMPELVEVDEATAVGLAVLLGAHRRLRHRGDAGSRRRSRSGRPLAAPTPIFTKLDPSIVDEELARLGRRVTDAAAERRSRRRCRSSTRTPTWTRWRSGPGVAPPTSFVGRGDGRGARGRRGARRSRSATRWRRRGGASSGRTAHPDVYAAVAVHPTEVDRAGRRRLRRARAAGRRPQGGGGRRDRAGLLLGPHRAGRSAGALPPPHRPGQAGRASR